MIAPKQPLKGGLGGGAGKPLVPTPAAPPASPGAEVDSRTPGKDLRLIGAAVRRGWVVSDQMLAAIPVAMANLALRGEDERARVNAARVLVEMHGQNDPAPQASVQVGVSVDTGAAVAALLREPGYVRFAHSEATPDASDIRPRSN